MDNRPVRGTGAGWALLHAPADSTFGKGRGRQMTGLTDTAQLTMYSTAWCGYCHRLKKQFEREGIRFHVVDIEADPEAAAFVENVNGGNQTVPTITFADGTAMTNPSLAQVTAKLAELKATA